LNQDENLLLVFSFALPTNNFCFFLGVSFFLRYQAVSNYFAAAITNQLYFSNAVIRLKNLNRQKLFSFFCRFVLSKQVLNVISHCTVIFFGTFSDFFVDFFRNRYALVAFPW